MVSTTEAGSAGLHSVSTHLKADMMAFKLLERITCA